MARKIGRSAKTGRFTPVKVAKLLADTHVVEAIKDRREKKKKKKGK